MHVGPQTMRMGRAAECKRLCHITAPFAMMCSCGLPCSRVRLQAWRPAVSRGLRPAQGAPRHHGARPGRAGSARAVRAHRQAVVRGVDPAHAEVCGHHRAAPRSECQCCADCPATTRVAGCVHAQQSRAPAPGCASARERCVGMSAPARGHAQCTSAGDAKFSKGCSSACDGGPPKITSRLAGVGRAAARAHGAGPASDAARCGVQVPRGAENTAAIDILFQHIRYQLAQRSQPAP